ncbi:hypothetical protein [Tenacibaculum sp.]|uniref:hypothetical protein n=1 Tax=Tenacibaculum sp. TaxID=1906242 RepID=UPI003D0B02B1
MSNIFNKYFFLLIFLLKGVTFTYADQNSFEKNIYTLTSESTCIEVPTIAQNTSEGVYNKFYPESNTEKFLEVNEIEDKTQDEDENKMYSPLLGGYFSALLHAQFFEEQRCLIKEKTQRIKKLSSSLTLKLHVKFEVFII